MDVEDFGPHFNGKMKKKSNASSYVKIKNMHRK